MSASWFCPREEVLIQVGAITDARRKFQCKRCDWSPECEPMEVLDNQVVCVVSPISLARVLQKRKRV